jgi:hypothetical protein
MAQKSYFHWIEGSLLQDIGLPREPWRAVHALRAEQRFSDERLQQAAVVLAALHPHVIDYIEQAPVLVVAAAGHARGDLRSRKARLQLAAEFIAKAAPANRLNPILKAYGVGPALKHLAGDALALRHLHLLAPLRAVPDVGLAQVLPRDPDLQRQWLHMVQGICDVCGPVQRFRQDLFTWAVLTFDHPEKWQHADEVLDWVRHGETQFQPQLRYRDAKAAADRWHAALANRRTGRRSLTVDLRIADIGALPMTWTADGLQLKALVTQADLIEESGRMHHCVRTYWGSVIEGNSRIFSIRRAQVRLATLELRPEIGASDPVVWRIAQLRGHCNAAVSPTVRQFALAYLEAANAAVREAAEAAEQVLANAPLRRTG